MNVTQNLAKKKCIRADFVTIADGRKKASAAEILNSEAWVLFCVI